MDFGSKKKDWLTTAALTDNSAVLHYKPVMRSVHVHDTIGILSYCHNIGIPRLKVPAFASRSSRNNVITQKPLFVVVFALYSHAPFIP
jgi:hypothetical protein